MAKTDILSRRVAKVLPSKEGLSGLMSKRKIRLYQGFDATGKLHIGHGVGLSLMMDFARAGHEVIFLFGTGTVLVGDPSQRETTRKLITEAEIAANIKNWQRQAAPIVDFNKVEIKQNGEWLTKLTLKDIIKIASQVTAIQLFKRESFQNRIDKGDTVWYHETMYPLLQGYDSVVMDVDLEIGGTDQEFNMLMGRELLKKMKNKEKYVLTVPLILGTDGQKMSASKGNCIWMDDVPADMFGKLMSIPDEQTLSYLELCTNLALDEISRAKSELKNPRDLKALMAAEVVKIYHGDKKAVAAAQAFNAQFTEGKFPSNMETVAISARKYTPQDLLTAVNLAESKSEARRLIEQGGFRINNRQIDGDQIVNLKSGDVLQIGKRNFKQVK